MSTVLRAVPPPVFYCDAVFRGAIFEAPRRPKTDSSKTVPHHPYIKLMIESSDPIKPPNKIQKTIEELNFYRWPTLL